MRPYHPTIRSVHAALFYRRQIVNSPMVDGQLIAAEFELILMMAAAVIGRWPAFFLNDDTLLIVNTMVSKMSPLGRDTAIMEPTHPWAEPFFCCFVT